jgi:hypothetical protein
VKSKKRLVSLLIAHAHHSLLFAHDSLLLAMNDSFTGRVYHFLEQYPHGQRTELARILSAKTSVSTSGFPYISQTSFALFLQEVPHLFTHGNHLVEWLTTIEQGLEESKQFSQKEIASINRAIFVLRHVVFSAAICAPPDLWILKHILSVHSRIGLLKLFEDGVFLDRNELADRFALDRKHLSWDLAFLHSRGYLRCRGTRYALEQNAAAGDLFQNAEPLADEFLRDMVDPIARVITRKASDEEQDLAARFYNYASNEHTSKTWHADSFQVSIGYRLVPTVLAFHNMKSISHYEISPAEVPPFIVRLLNDAGMVRGTEWTQLGARVLSRGPGPFGIVHAYVPYMRELENKLRCNPIKTHVQRAKNIAASQAANRKTFIIGNDSLDRFCKEQNFHYRVYIEHALGQGEATRQRLERNGESAIQYFGADLEDAAIDAAAGLQCQGILPQNMIFIRRADIANPDAVISSVREHGFDTTGAVMFVGNGFHEIRAQTNAKVIEVFKQYCEAGLLLIFTEESALGDHDLMNTGWNTYHAGFRYVHELSGQGLRPAAGLDREGRYSWKICASLGGFAVLPRYSAHTRTIYPFPRKGGYNPPISMTYFCVPQTLARALGFYPVTWTQTEPKFHSSSLLDEDHF